MKQETGGLKPRWKPSKRLALLFAVLLPVALVWTLHRMASWRPRHLANGKTAQSGDDITTGLGTLQAISNNSLFFDHESEEMQLEKYSFGVLELDGRVRRVHLPQSSYDTSLQLLSDTSVVIWSTQELYRNEITHFQTVGQIFDCERMRLVKKLQTVTTEHSPFYEEAQQVVRGDKVLLVTQFAAMEWNLSSGRLLHKWKLRKSNDNEWLTHTHYSSRTDTFVQVVADRIRVWSNKTGKLIGTSAKALPNFKIDYGEGDPPGDVEFSPDGELIAYNTILPDGNTGPTRVARCDSAQVIWQLQGEWIHQVHFSPDGREAVFYSSDPRRFTVRDSRTGRVLRYLQAPPTDVDSFSISPDGNSLCSVCQGNIWWQRLR